MLPTEDTPRRRGGAAVGGSDCPSGSWGSRRPTPTETCCAYARQVQKRPYVLVFSLLPRHRRRNGLVMGLTVTGGKPGNPGPAVDPTTTSKVVEFNDIDALRDALSARDVACVLMEPAMTNVGIVLPHPATWQQVRDSLRRHRHASRDRRDAHVERRSRRLHAGLGLCGRST